MCYDSKKAVQFCFNGSLQLKVDNPEIGEAKEEIEHSWDHQNPDVEIKFNPEYILDFLNAVDTDSVSFAVRDGEFKGLLQQGDYRYIVMPMRV
jgi:DNA polymerase-3 subunit beta